MLRTCHNVLHDGYDVGGLAERGGVVVFILKQREGREAGWEKGKMASSRKSLVQGCSWPTASQDVTSSRHQRGEDGLRGKAPEV